MRRAVGSLVVNASETPDREGLGSMFDATKYPPSTHGEGTTDQRGRSHPPQCTTSPEDRQIVRMARKTSIAWSTLDAEPQMYFRQLALHL
ncbi:hypothetical protein TNCV_1840961 [Trichonephila clavipes]|nr:hypothetical protein TNCV_1840961 [Trichonephila clavipes]